MWLGGLDITCPMLGDHQDIAFPSPVPTIVLCNFLLQISDLC
jgi:hypothetical protein